MIILGLDTSTTTASVALVEDGKLIAEQIHNPKCGQSRGNHAEILLPLIQSVLSRGRISLNDVAGIALSIGPGSFTGLRIALATVKGLVYGWRVPVVGVSTLLANAARVRDYHGVVCALMDARKREVYTALYERRGATLLPLADERVCSISSVIEGLRNVGAVDPVIIGDGARVYGAAIQSEIGGRARICVGDEFGSVAEQVAILSEDRLRHQEGSDLATLVPRYLRSSEAEKARRVSLTS